MTTEEMAATVLRVIDREGDPTMGPIMEALGDDGQGELSWEIRPNVLVWANMSSGAIDAFEQLKPVIEPLPAHVMCYMFDGQCLTLPLAKALSRKGYKKPHWFPVRWVRRKVV